MDLHADTLRRPMQTLGAILLTAGAFYLSSGLHRVWWPVWLAPLPILFLAPQLRAGQAFAAALTARAIAAAFDFWHYVFNVVQFPLWLTIVVILVPAALFALAVVFYSGLLRKEKPWLAILAFPITVVAGEYVCSLSQGTFFSTGYTQLANLTVLQLAALSGLWGISFVVNLFPAGMAAILDAPAKFRPRMAISLAAFYVCVLSYGVARLYTTPPTSSSVIVGFVENHAGPNIFPPDVSTTMAMYEAYAARIRSLAERGAQFIILPEMTALIPDAASAKVDEFFEKTSRNAHVQVLLGVLHTTGTGTYNEARLYSSTGQIETVYRKHHLVPTWESRSTPGNGMSLLTRPEGNIGIEICRDMDYPELSRHYAHQQVGLMLVPAWDQGIDVDAAWHGHLSLLRGVESGFTMVRTAKNGLLTASDDRGRILTEEPTRSNGDFVTMMASVPVRHDSTLYQNLGDWFAWIDLLGLAALIAVATRQFTPKRLDESQKRTLA